MSLLEDVFLEDEAGEAQELERVIEGDELDERPRTPDSNDNSEKEDEAEEDKRVVDHTAKAKKVVKNPRFILNPARLTGPRGIQVIPEHFKDFKFKGKGHEREDLDLVLKKLEHWAYRLYPKFKFDDCLKKMETLGKKRPVMVHLHKIRTDQYLSEETVQQQDSSGDEAAPPPPQEEDEFDRLLQQQIELARSTPAPGSAMKEMHTPMSTHRSPLRLPKVSSSPSISDEQKERMMRNRRLAEERRLARLNQSNDSNQNADHSTEAIPDKIEELNTDFAIANDAEITKVNTENISENDDGIDRDEPVAKKHNRSNNINSDNSDCDDDNVDAVNESVTVDVHSSVRKDFENTDIHHSDKENVAEDSSGSDQNISSKDVSRLTEERRLARLNQSNNSNHNADHSTEAIPEKTEELNTDNAAANDAQITKINTENLSENDDGIDRDEPLAKKFNRSNVFNSDSSDCDDDNVLAVNESVTVEIHSSVCKDVENTDIHNSDKENVAEESLESDQNVNSKDVITDNIQSNETHKELEADITEVSNNINSKEDKSNSEVTEVVSDNVVKGNDAPSNTLNETEKKKKDSDPLTEELMDVDFTDDF